MYAPTVIFENNFRAAHAVRDHINGLYPGGHRFTTRPYQHQAPDFTHWWFIPRKEWPAYHLGKLFIQQLRLAPECLYTGFYVERGLGKQLAGMPDVDPTHVMQPDWYWFEFLRHAQGGEPDSALREVLERSHCPVFVSVDLYAFNRVPSPEKDLQAPDDNVEFAIRSADLGFELAEQSEGIMSRLNECANLRELAEDLDGWRDLDYCWVNLFTGIRLQYGTETTGTWGADEIWHNALEPWAPWVG